VKKIINSLKKTISNKNNKKLAENFFSLSILQGLNYLLPLITLPYLVRVLGPSKYGLISFVQSFIQYFIVLTDYGFNLSATRMISLNKDNKHSISKIFSSVITIKILLLSISFLILLTITSTLTKFNQNFILYIYAFGIVIGYSLFPVWFFQGIEKMKYITLVNIIIKGIFTIAIFIFIKESNNYPLVLIINSFGYIIGGITSIIIVLRIFGTKYEIPKLGEIKYQLKEGWHIFISTISVSIYTNSNIFILGLFTDNTTVGYYTGAQKIINAIISLLNPVSQTVYPHINQLRDKSEIEAIKFIRKLLKLLSSSTLLISIILYIFSNKIILLVLGNDYTASILVFKIMSFLPFIIALSNVFGIQTMLTFNFKKEFSRILIVGSILDLLLVLILVPLYMQYGTAIAVFITIAMGIFIKDKGIKIIRAKDV